VCAALKKAIVDLGISPEKITVIPNGVDIAKFYHFPKREARKRLGLPLEKKIVLSVGGLIPRKGFDLLIRAAKMLCDRTGYDELYIVIVGEGPSRKQLEELKSSISMKGQVYLAGSIPHENLFLWYSAADLFCLASSREGWPNVLLETLACGTPVVAANIWGVPEVINADEVGIITERTKYAIADAISVALKKQWRRGALLEYARKHSWDRTAWAVHGVFEAVLDTERGSSSVNSEAPVPSGEYGQQADQRKF
jgi:glycosyltransferase involved in cell wall biosynthesis